MEVPRLGVELELQLPACTTATARPDPQPTERGQGSNLQPHGSSLDLLTTEPQWELHLFGPFTIFIQILESPPLIL